MTTGADIDADPGPVPPDAGMDEARLDCELCGRDATFRGRLRLHRESRRGAPMSLCGPHRRDFMVRGATLLRPYAVVVDGRWEVIT